MIRDPAHWVRILGSAGRIDWLEVRRSHRPEIGANLSGELVMNSTEDALKSAKGFKYDRNATTWVPEESSATTGSPARK